MAADCKTVLASLGEAAAVHRTKTTTATHNLFVITPPLLFISGHFRPGSHLRGDSTPKHTAKEGTLRKRQARPQVGWRSRGKRPPTEEKLAGSAIYIDAGQIARRFLSSLYGTPP